MQNKEKISIPNRSPYTILQEQEQASKDRDSSQKTPTECEILQL